MSGDYCFDCNANSHDPKKTDKFYFAGHEENIKGYYGNNFLSNQAQTMDSFKNNTLHFVMQHP